MRIRWWEDAIDETIEIPDEDIGDLKGALREDAIARWLAEERDRRGGGGFEEVAEDPVVEGE